MFDGTNVFEFNQQRSHGERYFLRKAAPEGRRRIQSWDVNVLARTTQNSRFIHGHAHFLEGFDRTIKDCLKARQQSGETVR
jgi:hypothetical protein